MNEAERHDEGRVHDGQDERSTAELMRQLSDQTTTLVRKEVELAKLELQAKGKQLGIGAGAFGGAGLVALYAVGALTACVIAALSLAMATWLAALIVTVLYAALAGALALMGKQRVDRGTPPVPEQAIDSTKEDVQWTKTRAKGARG